MGRWILGLALLTGPILFATAPMAAANQETIDEDSIAIASPGFDFGAGSFVLGSLTGSGEVQLGGRGERPLRRVWSGSCTSTTSAENAPRMRIDYYTPGSTFLSSPTGAPSVRRTTGTTTGP